MLVIPQSEEHDSVPKSLFLGILLSSSPHSPSQEELPLWDYLSNITPPIQSPLPQSIGLCPSRPWYACPDDTPRAKYKIAPLPQSPLKLFKLASPEPVYLSCLFLPESRPSLLPPDQPGAWSFPPVACHASSSWEGWVTFYYYFTCISLSWPVGLAITRISINVLYLKSRLYHNLLIKGAQEIQRWIEESYHSLCETNW